MPLRALLFHQINLQ